MKQTLQNLTIEQLEQLLKKEGRRFGNSRRLRAITELIIHKTLFEK